MGAIDLVLRVWELSPFGRVISYSILTESLFSIGLLCDSNDSSLFGTNIYKVDFEIGCLLNLVIAFPLAYC